MNLNTIDVRISRHEHQDSDGSVRHFSYISLYIDGERHPQVLDVWEIAFPPKLRIFRSFPFTCSCGVAGCAGWFEGYKVKLRKNTVEWKAIDADEAIGRGAKRFYSFDRGQYEDVARRTVDLIHEMVKEREDNQYPEMDYDYDLVRPTTLKDLDSVLEAQRKWVMNGKNLFSYTDLLTRHGRCA